MLICEDCGGAFRRAFLWGRMPTRCQPCAKERTKRLRAARKRCARKTEAGRAKAAAYMRRYRARRRAGDGAGRG